MKTTYEPVNGFLWFLYGLSALVLMVFGKLLKWKDLIEISSIFEGAQFLGIQEARRRSSYFGKRRKVR